MYSMAKNNVYQITLDDLLLTLEGSNSLKTATNSNLLHTNPL